MPMSFSHRVSSEKCPPIQKSIPRQTVTAVIGTARGLRGGTRRAANALYLNDLLAYGDRDTCVVESKRNPLLADLGLWGRCLGPLGPCETGFKQDNNNNAPAKPDHYQTALASRQSLVQERRTDSGSDKTASFNARKDASLETLNRTKQYSGSLGRYLPAQPPQENSRKTDDYGLRQAQLLGQFLPQSLQVTSPHFSCKKRRVPRKGCASCITS